ncbi:membrane protein FxsA [Aminobacter anthyllidis]|uniref:FxsA family protein n=1 Tax=Aminobacter anthyllidis TaxID=1035067 RepID=UPI002455C0F6|nr:FxsA family protein [Aminobacter anthyllidis]MDH4987112.1 membrane protein FxsA [Aminobacter anthyllidis]
MLPLLLLLALPLLEIAGFVVVGSEIGVLATIGLILLSGIVGSILLRVQGFGVMTRVRAEMNAGRDPSKELANGAMIVLAGILLLIPGFISDIVGILLFLPPVRALAWRFLSKRVRFSTDFGGFTRRGGPAGGKTIDLDEDDFKRQPDPNSPWRSIRDE